MPIMKFQSGGSRLNVPTVRPNLFKIDKDLLYKQEFWFKEPHLYKLSSDWVCLFSGELQDTRCHINMCQVIILYWGLSGEYYWGKVSIQNHICRTRPRQYVNIRSAWNMVFGIGLMSRDNSYLDEVWRKTNSTRKVIYMNIYIYSVCRAFSTVTGRQGHGGVSSCLVMTPMPGLVEEQKYSISW